MSTFNPSGVLTLMTDFGNRDPFVGIIKGVILERFKEAQIVDLTHEAAFYRSSESALWIEQSYEYFPKGTIHLVVIDPGVGTQRHSLIVTTKGHAFIAPDNGVLSSLVQNGDSEVIRIQAEKLGPINLGPLSSTFHARDFFAPIAAELACGRATPHELGTQTSQYSRSKQQLSERRDNTIHGVIVTSDHFGNLITNIGDRDLKSLHTPIVLAGDHVFPVVRTYGDVEPGQYLALLNSFGTIEIARSEGNAAKTLGLELGSPVIMREAAPIER